MQNAEQLRIAEAQQKAAGARTSAAWRRMGPTATLTGSWTHRTQAATKLGQETNALAAGAEIAMSLWDPSAAPLLRAAKYLERAQDHSTDIARRGIAFAAADAYLSASVAQLELQASQQRLTASSQAVSEAEARFRAGIIAQDTLLQFELDHAQTEAYHSAAQTSMRRALSVLRLLTHQPIEAHHVAAAATDPSDYEPTTPSRTPTRDLHQIAVYDARIDAARALSREPRLRLLPSLSASARYNTSSELNLLGIEPYWTLQALARWPLWDGGVRYAEARAGRADAEALELERSGYLRQLESDIALAYAEIADADSDLVAARKRQALAQRHSRAVDTKFSAGLASALERSNAYATALEGDAALAAAAARAIMARNHYADLTGSWPVGISEPLATQEHP